MINKKKKYIGRLTLATAITSILFSGCGAAQKELAQTDNGRGALRFGLKECKNCDKDKW